MFLCPFTMDTFIVTVEMVQITLKNCSRITNCMRILSTNTIILLRRNYQIMFAKYSSSFTFLTKQFFYEASNIGVNILTLKISKSNMG